MSRNGYLRLIPETRSSVHSEYESLPRAHRIQYHVSPVFVRGTIHDDDLHFHHETPQPTHWQLPNNHRREAKHSDSSESDPRIKVFLKGPRDVEDTKNGQKEGKLIWYGSIPPGKEAVLYSEWEVRAPVDVEWRVECV